MADIRQLPYILRLLDDPSAVVPDAVRRELSAFGPSLEDALVALHAGPAVEQMEGLREILRASRGARLKSNWTTWKDEKDDKARLESALSLLAGLEFGPLYPHSVGNLLDNLASEFHNSHPRGEALSLAGFLFSTKGLHGCPEQDYYNPLNSNLIWVIERGRGLPLSLAAIYILVGKRLGIQVEGCNLPGHFMALARVGKRRLVIDCFNGGRIIENADLRKVRSAITIDDIARLECRSPVMIARALRNLITAYRHAEDSKSAELMADLLTMTGDEDSPASGRPGI